MSYNPWTLAAMLVSFYISFQMLKKAIYYGKLPIPDDLYDLSINSARKRAENSESMACLSMLTLVISIVFALLSVVFFVLTFLSH